MTFKKNLESFKRNKKEYLTVSQCEEIHFNEKGKYEKQK